MMDERAALAAAKALKDCRGKEILSGCGTSAPSQTCRLR